MDRLRQSARQRQNRAYRVRKRIRGTSVRPRLSVHRTGKHIYAQIVDDDRGVTLCAVSSVSLHLPRGGNVAAAKQVGEAIGNKAKEAGVARLGFDRGANRYHGRIKALADAVRAAGMEF